MKKHEGNQHGVPASSIFLHVGETKLKNIRRNKEDKREETSSYYIYDNQRAPSIAY